jgi:hypothetical protein
MRLKRSHLILPANQACGLSGLMSAGWSRAESIILVTMVLLVAPIVGWSGTNLSLRLPGTDRLWLTNSTPVKPRTIDTRANGIRIAWDMEAALRYSQATANGERQGSPRNVIYGKPASEPTLGAVLMRPTPRGFVDLFNPFAPLPQGRRTGAPYVTTWSGDRPPPFQFGDAKNHEPVGFRLK